MTKKRCPLGEACDLTTAWMAGAARARDNISAGHLHLQLKVNRVGGAYIEDDEGMELDCVTMDGAFNLRAVAEGLRQGPDRVAPLEAEVKAQAAEIERLRGDLKKARDVIDWALICWDDHNKHGYNMQGDWVSDARTTLAELKGQDDE